MRLEDYNFYQENAPPHRVIRGYPAKGRWPSGENEEEDLLEADSSNKKVGRCDGDVTEMWEDLTGVWTQSRPEIY